MKRILLLSTVLFWAVGAAWAQQTVTGTVTSGEDGSTLPSVAIQIKGTGKGVTTDIDGKYTIEVPSNETVLVYSFYGFASQEQVVGNRTTINVSMQLEDEVLDAVVVTAFGIKRAPDEITYQTEKIETEELLQGQQQNAALGLTGKVAGLQINVQNNGVNPQSQILLRGPRSISANNEALIVIDGSISTMGAFNDLNPQDIDNVDILKGASAAALYGSQASNGAVIVTTKKGRANERFTLGINSAVTFEKVAYLPDFQTEYGIGWAGHYDPIENTNWGPRFDGIPRQVGPSFPDGYPLEDQVVPYAPIKDNLYDFYETGNTVLNTVYLTGGSKTGSYYMSVGKTDTDGIIVDDEYSRNTFRLNASQSLGKLSLGLNSTYSQDETSVVGSNIGDQNRPLYWFVLNTPANIPLSSYKDWDNPNSYAYADNYYNAYYQNPYWAIGTNRNNNNTSRINASLNGTYDILENISLNGQIGVNRVTSNGLNWRDAQTYNEDLQPAHSAVSSFVVDYNSVFQETNGNLLLQGDFRLNDDFTIKPILGTAFISTMSENGSIQANNLSIPGFYDVSNGTGAPVVSTGGSERRIVGAFGDMTIGYRNWAYLNLSGRQDWVSTLSTEDNSYFYPQASLSVVLSEAIPAIVDNGVVSDVKLTASKAIVYNDLNPYAINEIYFQPGTYPLGEINSFALSGTTVDPNISPEKLDTWEFGLTLGLLENRFSLTGSYFNTVTTNLITYTTPSYASGASSYLTNIGEMQSTGMELVLDASIIRSGNFKWDANINYTTYEAVINEIKPGLDEIAIDDFGTYGTFAIKGEAFPQLKAQSYVRDPQGRVVVDPATGNPLVGSVRTHGKTTPDFIIGATNRLQYKGFVASATLDYRTGHIYYSQGNDAMEFTGRSIESVSANRQDFIFPNSVIKVGENYIENTIPVTDGIMGFWQNTFNDIKENYVKDATALKIREVAVNYELPKSILDNTGFIKKVRVGFVGRNLFTKLANQSNFSDPEFRNTRSTDDANGIGIGGYLQGPPTSSYGFTINAEF